MCGCYFSAIICHLSPRSNSNPAQDEGYHPHAASTYLTEHIGGIYSVEQGREITGFTSSQLPLPKSTFSEDTESQYADELRRQAYIQTLGRSHTSLTAPQYSNVSCLTQQLRI